MSHTILCFLVFIFFFVLLQMLLTNSVSTCLSPTVHYMVCKLGYETKANHDINTIISNSGEINWETITKHVQYTESGVCKSIYVLLNHVTHLILYWLISFCLIPETKYLILMSSLYFLSFFVHRCWLF